MSFLSLTNWVQSAGSRVKQLLEISTLPQALKVPPLEPFDEDALPIREIDHSGDDPGPETMPSPFVPATSEQDARD